MLEEHHEEHRRRMFAAGEIAAAIYNTNRTEKSDPIVNAADFVPKPLGEISRELLDPPAPPEDEPDLEGLASFFGTREEAAKARLERES